MDLGEHNWQSIIANGFHLKSSGTTGVAKPVFQPTAKLVAANAIAVQAQRITPDSRILTVCNMDHAGGLLAQTLPALSIGASVTVTEFNAFKFWRDIPAYSHTHLTPAHCELLIHTKTFADAELHELFITCGSSEVSFDIIEAFVRRGATFMCNWGMTEIGPIVINTIFDSVGKVETYRNNAVASGTLMGDRYFCDYTVENNSLLVRGDSCVYDDWFDTKDRVQINSDGAMYFLGRNTVG